MYIMALVYHIILRYPGIHISASFGDSDWYQYLYYVDPYRANYGNGTTYGEHQDTVSNVFSSVNHTYGIVIH